MDLQSVSKRIEKLLARTTENGCTEGEAMAAMEMAERLIREYQITLSELQLQAEGVVVKSVSRHSSGAIKFGKEFDHRRMMLKTLGDFTSCSVWYEDYGNESTQLKIVGLRSDVDLCSYLLDSLSLLSWNLAVANTAHIKGERRTHRRDFLVGFRAGLFLATERIRKAREKEAPVVTTDGKDLVVVKNALVANKVASLNYSFDKGKSDSAGDKSMYVNGVIEGAHANLSRPVGSQQKQKLLQ
jgi:hypothetical protein